MVRPKLDPKLLRIAQVLLLVPAALLAFTCFTGRFTKHIESAGPVPASEIPGRRLQWSTEDCELVQWDDLCGHQLPVGKCFRIQPRTASVCELLGPDNSAEPSLLLGDGLVTLQTEGSLRITGNLRVKSARFEAESIVFQDAQVETQQSAANSSAQGGGTFRSRGVMRLEKSNVTVTGGRALCGGGLAAGGDITLDEASLLKVVGSMAVQDGGGLHTAGALHLRGGSQIMVEATSAARGGGFFARGEVVIAERSLIRVRQTQAAGLGGGFMAEGMLTLAAGTLDLENTHATTSGGGFAVSGSVLATNGSAIHIRSSRAGISAGGFLAEGQYVNFTNRSTVHMQNVRAEHYAGGFYARTGSVIIESMSEVMVVNGHAAKYDGGGFVSRKRMEVDDGSSIRLRSVSAGRSGGGFMASRAKALIRGNSRLLISDSHAKYGGGFYAAFLEVSNNATVGIQNSSAGKDGGGFYACGCHDNPVLRRFLRSKVVKVSNSSTLRIDKTIALELGGGFASAGSVVLTAFSNVAISDSQAMQGGGMYVYGSLRIVDGSMLRVQNVHAKFGGALLLKDPGTKTRLLVRNESHLDVRNATAGVQAGGFRVDKVLVAAHSQIRIEDCNGGRGSGGGFFTSGLQVSDHGSIMIRNCSIGGGNLGGGFYVESESHKAEASVLLANSSMVSIHATNASYGAGFATNGQVLLANNSTLQISESHASKFSGGFAASALQVTDQSAVFLENVTAARHIGGFRAERGVLVSNSSEICIRRAVAEKHRGGFATYGPVVVAKNSQISVSDSYARSGAGGGFIVSQELAGALAAVRVTGGSTISISNTASRLEGGGFAAWRGDVVIADGSKLRIRNTASFSSSAGGFGTDRRVLVANNSLITIRNSTSKKDGGGFRAERGVLVSNSSEICIRRAVAAKDRGGFASYGPVVVAKNSQISVSDSYARSGAGGGFIVSQELAGALAAVRVTGGSTISISNTVSRLQGGGFAAWRGDVVIADGSKLRIRNTASFSSSAGGFGTDRRVLVANNSLITIRNSTSKENSGGFWTKSLEVTTRSAVHIESTQTGGSGGGFWAEDLALVAGHSEVTVSDSHAIEGSGGGFQTSKLYLEGNSSIDLQTASAGDSGGGVNAANSSAGSESLVVANGSALRVRNATARLWGGGIRIIGRAVITGWSNVQTSDCHATSYDGGGISVSARLLLNESSDVNIQNATAGGNGGGLHTEGSIAIAAASTLAISNSTAEHGGGFHAELYGSTPGDSMPDLSLDGGLLVVSDSRANGKGSAGFVQDRILVGGGSSLHVHHAVGGDISSVVAAGCLQLSPGATVLLQDVVGGHGFGLENADCPGDCANRTFEIAAGASLKASGHLSSGFLSMNTCPLEVVHLSDIHLQSWSSPLLSTPVHQVVVRDVSISYAPPLHDVLVLATTDSFKADSLDVSCKDCAHGVAFNASGNELRALSTPSLVCPLAASVSEGMLQRCTCANHQTTRQAYADRQVVMLQEMMKTCTFCEPHTQFINGTCRKCAPYKAWSDGMSDSCHFLPQDGTQFGALFAASASCIFLAFLFYQILQAPLVIVDAKSQRIPHRLRKAAGKAFPEGMEQRSFSMSLQGPIVDLPQFLSRQLNRQLCYRVKGTGLQWLDFSPDNENAVKIQSVDRSKLEVQDAHVPYDCAAAVGALYATNLMRLMLLLCAMLFVVVLLPVALQVAIMSGNGVAHVLVTSGYCALPLCLAALILHPAVAWLIEQHCRRTPFAKLLEDYRWLIQFDPNPGPHADNPSNQGLMALTLWELWGHFESFILDRNMHFVVSNIVRPLTRDKQVSFVSLWGGRQVDYFVSHSWATSFAHFVRSIHCHARSREGQRWMDVSYWICSFANNQWNLEVELGETIMDSAFARTLRGGIKGVAMVLDHEVQPLTRVWCLFEFLLSKQLELELVFATDVGVIGDDGCTSFDIALELGKKIESLQVANCDASSDGDRTRIFDFIVSSLGSLESMDEQIRDLMGQMLEKNLANVGFATSSLLQRLGRNARSASASETVSFRF